MVPREKNVLTGGLKRKCKPKFQNAFEKITAFY